MSAIPYELTLQANIRRQMDAIVRAANADAARLKESGMDKNQIRNVLNVAEESHSLAVVTNFIRYQLGRSQTGPAWRHNGFGMQVIEQIESPTGIVHRQAEQVLKALRDQYADLPENVADRVRYELMRHYLGYLNRAFVYGKETKQWDDLRQARGEA
ncbi:MAG TPA: hypothetical protein EYH32_10610 [Anaerolineae bacterium]|nr:hypothetical protein [Anaerolineae bacterium]